MLPGQGDLPLPRHQESFVGIQLMGFLGKTPGEFARGSFNKRYFSDNGQVSRLAGGPDPTVSQYALP